jgi:hypothetical protein
MSVTDDKLNRRIEDLRLILKDFLKVIRVVSMYPEDNPLPQSLRRTFAERLVDLVEDYGQLGFRVKGDHITFGGETVFTDRSREECLAEMFFETGVVAFTFKPELEVDDVNRLLDAVKLFQNSNRRTADLAAILWEAEIGHFGFETVEDVSLQQYEKDVLKRDMTPASDGGDDGEAISEADLQKYRAIFDASAPIDEDPTDSGRIVAVEEGYLASDSSKIDMAEYGSILGTGDNSLDSVLKISEAVEAMGFEDVPAHGSDLPDTKLILNDAHQLSEEEEEQVVSILARDAEFGEYEAVCELLKEILHQESEITDFNESVTICEKCLSEFLSAGKLTYAADLLRYFGTLEGEIRTPRPMWAERLKEARITAGSRERLSVLCNALNEYPHLGAHELRRYLDNFDWEALMGITDMLGNLTHDVHRHAVRDYLTEQGRDRVPIVAKGIFDKQSQVVIASVAILANIGSSDALKYLSKAVEHDDIEVRRTLAAELAECPSDECIGILRRLVIDSDAEVRREAVRAMVARRGQPAFDALAEIIADGKFYSLGTDDQRAILVAYSTLGGDAAVDTLVRLGTKPNPFGNQRLSIYREAAFEALSHNRGEKAERTLVNLAGNWRSDIKAHAKAALQKRRELIYGESND